MAQALIDSPDTVHRGRPRPDTSVRRCEHPTTSVIILLTVPQQTSSKRHYAIPGTSPSSRYTSLCPKIRSQMKRPSTVTAYPKPRPHTRWAYSVVGLSLPHQMCSPTDIFAVFNGAFQIDPHGITPFIPYIIRSDLGRILSDTDNDLVSPSSSSPAERLSMFL